MIFNKGYISIKTIYRSTNCGSMYSYPQGIVNILVNIFIIIFHVSTNSYLDAWIDNISDINQALMKDSFFLIIKFYSKPYQLLLLVTIWSNSWIKRRGEGKVLAAWFRLTLCLRAYFIHRLLAGSAFITVTRLLPIIYFHYKFHTF